MPTSNRTLMTAGTAKRDVRDVSAVATRRFGPMSATCFTGWLAAVRLDFVIGRRPEDQLAWIVGTAISATISSMIFSAVIFLKRLSGRRIKRWFITGAMIFLTSSGNT